MFQSFHRIVSFLDRLTGSRTGVEFQIEWWAIGFMTGITICICGAIVRAIRMSGGSKGEL